MHGTELFAYLWRLLGDRHDAEDCLQEVFLRAFRAYERTSEDSNYRAWLYKIATNRAYTFRKRRARILAQEIELVSEARASVQNSSVHIDVQDDLERIAHAVEQLPNHQRVAILMRKYQELSYTEIASVLDCSEEAARANVYQGLKKLRNLFSQR
jgi:RNA polymerase sigma-70 factor (ECF subfamily)